MKVSYITARQIFDSRGAPTVEVDLVLDSKYVGTASAPSGASRGECEAYELRDNEKERYYGNSVFKAVASVTGVISKSVLDKNFSSQEEFDRFLIELDGTENKRNLGANAILPVSIAFNKAFAKLRRYDYFMSISNGEYGVPKPMLNVINGGAHADNILDFQEFMIIPLESSMKKNLENAYKISCTLKNILKKEKLSVNVGDEGGFAPQISKTKNALDLLLKATCEAGLIPREDICFGLDIAANEIYDGNSYNLLGENLRLSAKELVSFYSELLDSYPIISLEDPIAENDLEGWKCITQQLANKVMIVGDDLFVTNEKKLNDGIKEGTANAILIKMNQIGTLTETLNCINLAKKSGYQHIISHRSGETEDVFISHLAISTKSPYIKAGALSRTDRVCKYNELLRIEERFGFFRG